MSTIITVLSDEGKQLQDSAISSANSTVASVVRRPRGFTQAQTAALETYFGDLSRTVSTHEALYLATTLGLTPVQVTTWFRNRKSKARRQGQIINNSSPAPVTVQRCPEAVPPPPCPVITVPPAATPIPTGRKSKKTTVGAKKTKPLQQECNFTEPESYWSGYRGEIFNPLMLCGGTLSFMPTVVSVAKSVPGHFAVVQAVQMTSPISLNEKEQNLVMEGLQGTVVELGQFLQSYCGQAVLSPSSTEIAGENCTYLSL